MTVNKATVLIVEDETSIRDFLRVSFEAENLKVVEATDGATAIAAAHRYRPDLYVLDLGLPDKDGIEVLRELRRWTTNPIVVVTARSQEDEKVMALDAGADDYLTKPFGVHELKARIRVALRHLTSQSGADAAPILFLGDVKVDLETRRITKGEQEIHLTPTEFNLLAMLARAPGKVITQRALLIEVWGAAYERETHYLRIYMKQLRQKLEPDPRTPKYLITETGVGYRLITS